jgi:hypothetical protein
MRFCGASSLILVTVTPTLALYGSTRWSCLAGPVAALSVWALESAGRRERPPAGSPFGGGSTRKHAIPGAAVVEVDVVAQLSCRPVPHRDPPSIARLEDTPTLSRTGFRGDI